MQSHINVGFGFDITIAELADEVAKAIDYQGNIVFDSSRPDGAPRKLMDSRRLDRLGWFPRVNLTSGLDITYNDFVKTPVK